MSATAAKTRSVVVGTAGHIDHGKTALVLAMTGTDTDCLPEEKARGITIDLGFASLILDDAQGNTAVLSLIDVPGHLAFIHNMLAGTGGIDVVLLVVAADEGFKAQTVEHLAICGLLGIRAGVVALSKCDAVSAERLQEAREEIELLVEGTFLEHAPVVAVSAYTKQGIDKLKTMLLQAALQAPEHDADAMLRLPLDRAFSVPGFGTVVTGTLLNGKVQPGDTLELQPVGRSVRVRGVQVHNTSRSSADAPTRIALNLAGIEVGEVQRGDVLIMPGTLSPTVHVDVELSLLEGTHPVRHRGQVAMNAHTAEVTATILLYETGEALPGSTRLARLRLSAPMLLAPGDRFVLRRRSPPELLGGGRVLDATPLPAQRKAHVYAWLIRILNATPAQQLAERLLRRGVRGIGLNDLAQEMGLTADAVRRLAVELPLVKNSADAARADKYAAREAVATAAEAVLKELMCKEFWASSRAELLSRTRMPEWVLDLAVARLAATKPMSLSGTEIMLERPNAINSRQSQQLAKIEGLYRTSGLASPIVSVAATELQMPPKELKGLIAQLIRSGKLVRMGSDTLLVHAGALAKLKEDLAKLRGESLDVGRFKELTGLTRKHAIPLLEFLDRTRVTLNREGDRIIL